MKNNMFNSESRTKNSITNAATGMAAQLAITLLQFVSRTVFIKCLGAAYLGISGLFSNILTMLSLTELGLDTAINFKLYKPLADKDVPRLQILMKFYKNAYLAVGSLILVLGLVLIPFLPNLIKDYDSIIELGINPVLVFLMYLGQSSISYLFFASKGAILKADQKMAITNNVRLIVIVVVTVAQIISLVLFKNFILYTAIGISSTILLNVITARIAEKQYPLVFKKTEAKIERTEVRSIFKDLGALFVFKVNDVVKTATDNIVLSAFIGISIVGLYSNYVLFFTCILVFLNMLYGAVDGSMGNLFATETEEKRYSLFQIMNYVTVLIFGASAVGIAVCADELLTTWIGTEYVIPGQFAVLVGVEMYFHGLKQNLTQIRNASGVFRQMWYRPLIGATINLVVSIWLVHPFGIHGVIIGTLASDIFANLLFDPSIVYKYSFGHFKSVREYYWNNIMYLALLVMIFFLDSYLCNLIVVGYGWLSVAIHILICAVSVPLVFTVVFYKRHENQYILNLLKNVVRIKAR